MKSCKSWSEVAAALKLENTVVVVERKFVVEVVQEVVAVADEVAEVEVEAEIEIEGHEALCFSPVWLLLFAPVQAFPFFVDQHNFEFVHLEHW